MTTSEPNNVVPLRKRLKKTKCPICSKGSTTEFRPFCSKRCADIDLGRWLNEDYRIPAEEAAELDDEEFQDL
ncbi:MAG: DNA gyrase inhibitor YacG [Rhodospirillaceae bacterium]|jgi:uncharacterized protein|nr:DNA gyrase inhibitor YacG [Rhodospirillaceae bacterium]